MGRASRRKRERRHGLISGLPPAIAPLVESGSLKVDWRPRHPMKISAALLELVEPFCPEPPTLQELQTFVGFGAIAWNASILDGAEREEHLRMMMGEVKEGDSALFESLLRDLIARKLRLFPDDRRLVASWEVTKNGSSYLVTAAALS